MEKKIRRWIQTSFRRSSSFNIILVIVLLLLVFNIVVSGVIKHYYEEMFLEKGRIMAVSGAASIQQVFESAITNGNITKEELFDTNYQPIPDTDPQKYHTLYDSFAEKNILLIEDAYLQDHDIVFAAAVDINGYVPAHNSIFSQPLTGNYDADLVANRNKRIFNDEVGIAAVKNTEPYLLQIYERDTGEIIWDISVPIFVYGEHWGAFRVGLSTIEVDAHIHNLTKWISFISLLVAVILLVISYIGSKPINNIIELSQLAKKIAVGDISSRSTIDRQDEIGLLSDSLNMIVDSQEELANAATKIANGNLSTEIVVRSEKDVVSLAFSKMVKNLRESIASLHNERGLLQALLDNSVDSIYFKDLESKFIRISRSQAMRFGLNDVKEAVGKSDFDFFAKEHAQAAFEDEQTIIRTGRPILYKEEEETWPDKESNWVLSTKLPLYDENNNVVGTFGISRDITINKKMENKLLQNQEKMMRDIEHRKAMQELLDTEKGILSTTLMSISDGVIATDSDGLITFMNKKAEEICGYDDAEALDMPVNSILRILDTKSKHYQDNTITFLFQIEKARNESKHHPNPTIENKNGIKILLNTSISAIKTEENRVNGYVIVFEDITEIQEIETQTALSQKMESIGQMASGIAHEINTPIQYVGDNLRYLQRAFTKVIEIFEKQRAILEKKFIDDNVIDSASGIDAADLKKVDWYIDEVPVSIDDALAGVERVRKIVLAMREFSHPSGTDKTFSNINNGIETTVTISRNEWKYVADVDLQLQEDLPLVNCYLDEINQVVLNMMINASHAIKEVVENNPEEKGKITICTKSTDKTVVISIADSGTGIPENIRDRVFDPFFTTKGVGKGTGQGLFLAHNIIVNKHGGKINIESQEGVGTTFIIEIPIGEEGEIENGTD